MPDALSSLERDVLDYLADYVRSHTYQPSVREIGAAFDIKSTKSVSELLQSLANKGWIERDSSRSRGVRLLGLDLGADVVSVPHIDVHLSEPSIKDPLEKLTLDRKLAGSSAAFLVSMVGNSLRSAGIWDGDLLLVEPATVESLDDNEIVVARLAGETTVCRIQREQTGDPMLATAGHSAAAVAINRRTGVDVLGRVTAVIRRLRTDTRAGLAQQQGSPEGAIAG